MKRRAALIALALVVAAYAANAHEVHPQIATAPAVVITLHYANGEPFAYERYALTPTGEETPMQVGNTDAAGRIVFLPGTHEKWRVQATSADGHGVNLEFAAPPLAGCAPAEPQGPTPRWLLAAVGLALIFGLFGLVQLFLRKKP
jgi:nickel transport protein